MKFTNVNAVDTACCRMSLGKTDLVLSAISNTYAYVHKMAVSTYAALCQHLRV
jgi:hypothetical protein